MMQRVGRHLDSDSFLDTLRASDAPTILFKSVHVSRGSVATEICALVADPTFFVGTILAAKAYTA